MTPTPRRPTAAQPYLHTREHHAPCRRCSRCGVSEEQEMLCMSGPRLVCQGCDSEIEREWVEEDPDNRRHSLDTFSPRGGL